MSKLIDELIEKSPDRRNFMKKMAIASAAVGAASTGSIFAQGPGGTPSDADIVQFALNLEYLEAEFYTVATTGKTLSQAGFDLTGTGTAGATTGGKQVTLSDPLAQQTAVELAANEQGHVVLLRGALQSLGVTPVAKPAIKLDALGIGFGSQTEFLALSRSFEDVGVTAYGGAAPLLQNKMVVGIAARILAVEALHTGNIRLLCARNNVPTMMLDGADHLPPPSGTQLFTTDSMALTETRTPGEVLYLVYGNQANALGGGFFPNGVNGNIKQSSAAAAKSDGATLTLTPNPIMVTGNSTTGVTTVSFNAPQASIIQVRIGSPTGPIFTTNINNGSMVTGNYVTDGTVFYLLDISNGGAGTVIATAVARVQKSGS